MSKSIFSDRLRTVLEEKSIKQVELCEKTGIGKSAMSQYLSGSFKPKHEKLIAIAKAVGVSAEWLIGNDEDSAIKDGEEMYIIASDSNMSGVNIPRGSEVSIDMTAIPKSGDIVCFSSKEAKHRIRAYNKDNDKIIFTASNLNCQPEIYSEQDLENGNLQIHGVANKVMIKL